MKNKIVTNVIIFIAAFTGSYIANRLVTLTSQKNSWHDMILFRNTVVDFRNYIVENSSHKKTEQFEQSCMNFYTTAEANYTKHENSEFAFCYKLFLQPDICCSPEKIDCFIEVCNQILEQLEKKINKPFWLFTSIFEPK